MSRAEWETSPVLHTDLVQTPTPRWQSHRRGLLLGAGAALALLAAGTASDFAKGHALFVNASPSLPYWAIWLTRSAVPKRGDLVLFMPPRSDLLEKHFGKDPHPFGKRVLGIAGDQVTRDGRRYFINGVPTALAKPFSRTGEPLALGPTGTIPAGCYFVGTAHKDGFDSRYAAIGWVCRPQILGVGSPIL
jgi:conjugal transfer pilin signal peptidase TrbI